MIDLKQRAQGALLGLACGDAVGTTLEFKPCGSFEPITDMVGGGPFGLAVGQWTDDTSMALCLAHSLLENGFDAADQMSRYVKWHEDGYMSCTGECFDIGNTVVDALGRYQRHGDPFAGSDDPMAAGNGSVMRLAPVPLFYHHDLDQCLHYAAASSRTTHAAEEAVEGCELMANLIWQALHGVAKDRLFDDLVVQPQTSAVKRLCDMTFIDLDYAALTGSGYVIESLESALWCFMHSDNFRDAILLAANIGNDADTTAAICGQLAGAYYGVLGIPQAWRDLVAWGADIQSLAVQLIAR